MTPLGISVVICCHNSSSRLLPTLTHLQGQQVGRETPWEVIVVDNASTDGTAEVALRKWPKTEPTTLRVAHEPRLGLSYARRRGLSEAQFEIVSFIDDDNWVCPNWIQLVSEIMSEHSNVGACGGSNEAVCEIDPPWWFDRFKSSFAVGSQGDAAGDVTPTRGRLWGAGLSIRKVAWEDLLSRGFRTLLADRVGDAQTSGGDTELCFALRLAGWRLWYDPRLRLRHFLPGTRLTWANLRRLHRGFGAASVWLDLYITAFEDPQQVFMRRVKRSRPWKIVAVVTRLLWDPVTLARAVKYPAEGDSHDLQVQAEIGRLLELVQARRKYALSVSGRKGQPLSWMTGCISQSFGE